MRPVDHDRDSTLSCTLAPDTLLQMHSLRLDKALAEGARLELQGLALDQLLRVLGHTTGDGDDGHGGLGASQGSMEQDGAAAMFRSTFVGAW